MKWCILSGALYGAKTWKLLKIDKKNTWKVLKCWIRMGKISWTNRVKNEEVLQRVKEERNSLRKIKRRKTSRRHFLNYQPY